MHKAPSILSQRHAKVNDYLSGLLKKMQRSSEKPEGFPNTDFQMDRVTSVLESLLRDGLVPQMFPIPTKRTFAAVAPIPVYELMPNGTFEPAETIGHLHINPELIRFLSDTELRILALHEGFHLRHFHELRYLGRGLSNNVFGKMVAMAIMRKQELDADSYASSLVGGEVTASLLIKIDMLGIANHIAHSNLEILNSQSGYTTNLEEILNSQGGYILRMEEKKLLPEKMGIAERIHAFIKPFFSAHPTTLRRIANSLNDIIQSPMQESSQGSQK
ncbi:MAG: M48 family metalloprotease [Candidatus Micrarchaeaceae archaeon]